MLTGRYMHVLGHRTQTHLVQDYEMNYYRAMKEVEDLTYAIYLRRILVVLFSHSGSVPCNA